MRAVNLRIGSLRRAWAACGVFLIVATAPALAADEGRAGGNPGDAEARAVVQRLIRNGRLELSTRPESAAKTFHFLIATTGREGAKTVRASWHVARDGREVAIVALPEDAKGVSPVYCCANGLWVGLDPARPGGLMLGEDAVANVTLTSGADGVHFEWGIKSGPGGQGSILFDAAALFSNLLEAARSAEFDAAKGVVTIRTEHNTCQILIPPRPADRSVLGFNELLMSGGGNHFQVVVGPTPRPKRDYFSLTKKAVMDLGLPVRNIGEEKTRHVLTEEEAMRLMSPNAESLKDPLARAAAEKLAGLLPPRKDK